MIASGDGIQIFRGLQRDRTARDARHRAFPDSGLAHSSIISAAPRISEVTDPRSVETSEHSRLTRDAVRWLDG